MRISVIGTGYVGLSTGVCLSEIGHHVICIDIDKNKINCLQQGISPIYEPGLETMLLHNSAAGRLHFTTSYQDGLQDSEIIILAVGTPEKADGSCDLTYLIQAIKDISIHLHHDTIIVVKSTVPVGTSDFLKNIVEDHTDKKIKISMIANPEFLKQGSAIRDTLHADRIIIGYENKQAAEIMQQIYQPLNVPILLTSIKSAEMIKYASNAFLATKISFINQIAKLCDAVGANIEDVAMGMGKDKRIGNACLQAGIGYGGSCFPKDTKALLHYANCNGIDFKQLKETIAINNHQYEFLLSKALNRFGNLKGKKMTILGLSFKPETDDLREAPSIKIAHSLIKHGATVVGYDPIAIENAKKILGDSIMYANSLQEAIQDSDAIFIVTEWNEFKYLNLSDLSRKMNHLIIFDGRNCLDENLINQCERIEYYPIGKKAIINGVD